MLIPAALLLALAAPLPQDFDKSFTGQTLRLDYHHVGNAAEHHVAYEGLRLEGPWPGSRTQLVDTSNLGKYLFVVLDPATNTQLYSRGFASIFGEWATTGEAKQQWKAIHESVRFPEPKGPVQLVLKERTADGTFAEFWSKRVDPNTRFVDRSALPPVGTVVPIQENGPAATKVDLLVLGEGYPADQAGEFEADLRRLTEAFFRSEPFATRRSDWNVRGLHVPSAEAGISNPRQGDWHATPLGLSFNAFDSDRYVLTYANRAIREAAALAPYDTLILLFNDEKYGGGGIFNLWSTVAAGSGESEYLFVHEFGHSFAGLADEYYTSQVSYEDFNPEGVEPWEVNITALLDPGRVKWADLMETGTPLPTPWNQDAYDGYSLAIQKRRAQMRADGASEADMEALFDEVRAKTAPMLQAEPHYGKVGAFEGGGYRAKGIYRSELDCIMFTRNPKNFCRVCSRGLERVMDLYTR